MKVGLDIGSTTIKCVVLDEENQIIHDTYERHYSQIIQKALQFLKEIKKFHPHEADIQIAISGSAGMGIAENSRIPFIQEVFATRTAAKNYLPGADVIIELGGEDAKILFFRIILRCAWNGSLRGRYRRVHRPDGDCSTFRRTK